MRRLAIAVTVLLVVGIVVAELVAVPLASRQIRAAAHEGGLQAEAIAVTSVARPATIDLLQGRLRDVQISGRLVSAGRLQFEEVDAVVAELTASLPQRIEAIVDITIDERAATAYLVARAPALARPTVAFDVGSARISDERVPFELAVRLDVREDAIVVQPSVGDDLLWTSLGMQLTFEVPTCVTLRDVELIDGYALARLDVSIDRRRDGTVRC